MSEKTKKYMHTNHAVFHHIHDLASRVVAQTGIPSDRFHMGKLILQSLKDNSSLVLQIDGGTNTSETNGSVLERSTRCAVALKNLGLQLGDVAVFMAPNHVDQTIPYYAALYLGIYIAAIDLTWSVQELHEAFNINKPKIVFCQNNKALDVEAALKKSNLKARIVTFDKGQFIYFGDLLHNVKDSDVKDFKPTDFDPEETIGLLSATSGSTGRSKSAILTHHKNLTIGLPHSFARYYEFPQPSRLMFFVSPIQWITAALHYTMSPILGFTRLQTSKPATKEHIFYLINTYKPTTMLISPNLMMNLATTPDCERCDFSCLESLLIGGAKVTKMVVNRVKELLPHVNLTIGYGPTETATLTFAWDEEMPEGCVGQPSGHYQHRLVDPDTLMDIKEPNVVGELWLKGPALFKGYYGDPEATKAAFSDDGWFRTGDLFFKDRYNHYIFVDRLNSLLKYRGHKISPVEVEEVIGTHPGVYDAVVVGVPDEECGDLLAAVVVRRDPALTAQEIKDWIKERLADSKHLRGGVVFMKEFPVLPTTKLDRVKLNKIVPLMERE